MPQQTPLSRYLLLGFAALMFGAALPDAELWFHRVQNRAWRAPVAERVVLVDPMPFR